MTETPRARLVGYGVAVLVVAVSLLMRGYVLHPLMGIKGVYLTFCPAVMIAAYFGGFRPGLLATILSAVAVEYLFIEPLYDVWIGVTEDLLAITFFVLVGTFLSGVCEALHRSRRRVAANERRFAITLSSIGDAVIATDKQARVTFMNPVAETLTGWPQGDATGKGLAEVFRIVNEETRQPVEDPAAKVLRMGTIVGLANHTVLLARDGREVPIDDSGAPIIEEGGGITGVVLVFRDISERLASDKRFRTFVDHATDAFFLLDEGGMVLDVNRQACTSLGYTRDELLGMTPSDFDPDLTPAEIEERDRKLNSGQSIAFESRHRRKDGTVLPVEVRGQAFWEGGHRLTVALARDITDRNRAEEALRKSEERFRSLVQNSSDIISLFDAEGTVLYQAPSVERLLGHRPQDRIGHNIYRDPIVHPEDMAAKRAFFDALLTQPGMPVTAEFRLRHADGSWRDIEAVGQNFLHDPSVAGIVANYRDVTDRKLAEAALRESEQRWRNLAEALPQFVWTASADGTADYFGTQIVEYTGVAENELLAWGWMDVLHPDDREQTRNSWLDAIANERNHEVEHRIRSRDGAYRWFTTRGVPIRDTAGHIVKWFGTCTDITEHMRSEQALRESEQRWRSLTEALPQLVWTATPDGACDYFSTQWSEYTGIPTEKLLGWSWLDALHPDDRERTRQAWMTAVGVPGPYDVEYRVRRTDGTYCWFKTRGVAIRDGEGSIVKWFGTCTDITDSKTAAEELRVAKEAAESANRAKDEFLANVSHEIRTPMNAILGMTELVLDTSLAEDQRQSLKTVKAAADNLLGIINDLLDFSKIEAGKLVLDPGDFSLRSALGDTLRTLAMRAHRKGLELISHVQPDVPEALVGDAGRLRQVLLNLVGNAIKFTEAGDVIVRVECATGPVPGGEVRLLFSITDTGIGIPTDKHEAIFRAFEQEDTSTTRKYGGSGLGLTIASRLVTLMGGKISVESQPGRGSIFTFTAFFRRQTQFSEQVSDQPPVLLHNLPVLIVDDNATNRYILEEWLHEWKMEPTAVGDGVAAMDALWQGATNERQFALVLLDARMPDIDGLALAARIRERTARSATRIILLTSGDRPDDAARSHQLGIDARLLKPVRQEELLETIYRVISRTNGDVPAVAGPAPVRRPTRAPDQTAAPLRILVAEDNEFNAQLLEQLLVRRGHRVHVAINGREALNLAGEGAFDLLLLDIHMPELDGFQVIQAIRDRERAAGGHLPVIALTARSRSEDRDKCLAAGMDDFLAKPIQAAALWDAIDRISFSDTPVPAASTSPVADKKPGLLDAQVLLAACGGDDAILRNICAVFRDRLPDHLQETHDALRDKDAARLREIAHKLHGMLAAFSTVGGTVASNLEDLAADGRLEDSESLVVQLDAIARELVGQIDVLSIDSLRYDADSSTPSRH